jgi:hypothetical protein
LKEKFLLNIHGFQAELDMEEDFLSYAQREKRNAVQFLPKVLAAEGPGSGSI